MPVPGGFDGSSAAPLGEFVVGQWVEHNLKVVVWLRLGSWPPACLLGVSEMEPRGTNPCSADAVLELGVGKSERALPGKGSESWGAFAE